MQSGMARIDVTRSARLRRRLAGLLCCVVFAVWLNPARSEQLSPQVWLNAGSYSRHFDRDRNFREDNVGLGAELWFDSKHAAMAGTFINSDRVRSDYLAYQWRPLQWQPVAGLKLGAGITLGAFDGYPRYRNGGWFPAALPVVSAEYLRVGVNLFVVPTIRDRLDGALVLQLKLRVW
jgi:hypothetical protein